MNDRFVAKRWLNLIGILFVTVVGTITLSLLHGSYLDELFVFLLLDGIFFVFLLPFLEHGRMNRELSANRETTFRRIFLGYLLVWLLMTAGSYLPEFLKPAMACALLMCACGTQRISIYTGLFLNAIVCLVQGSSSYELICYILLLLCGCILADSAEKGRLRLWHSLSIVLASAILPALFAYLYYQELRLRLLIFGGLEGIFVAIFFHFRYLPAHWEKEEEVPNLLDDILEESYPLKRELRQFSQVAYDHARRVSLLAGACARLVGADAKLCAAGGFYYHAGIMEGDAVAESGVHLAQRECFPERLIQILGEYQGEKLPISTVESAIVHMVDGLLGRMEAQKKNAAAEDEDQAIFIYRTLNDFSAQGLYDRSGLSMNMFLKIREYLVNQEILL